MTFCFLPRRDQAARLLLIRNTPFLAAPLALCSFVAQAQQDLSELRLEQPATDRGASGWNVSLGAGIAERPKYEGGDSYALRLVPMFSVSYDKGLFVAGPAGAGLNLVNWNGFKAGPIIGLLGGRREDADPHLNGTGDISTSLAGGVFAGYGLGPFSIRATVRQALTHQSNGLYGDLSFSWRHPLIDNRLFFGANAQMSFANAAYIHTFFGVTQEQSEQSGLPVYTPGGGIKDVGVNFSLDYRLSDHFQLRTFAGVRELVGDIGNSPIVEDKTQGLIGTGLAYHF